MMKALKVNAWMKTELAQCPYHAVYATSVNEWWILGSAYTLEEAQEILAEEIAWAEDATGEFMVVNHEGKRVKG